MLTQAVDHYLAVRRAAGFKLKTPERYLRYFVRFANARGDTHVRATSAIDWAAQAKTEVERHRRYQCLIGFARFVHAEEPRHEIPPGHVFCGYLPRPTPYLFTDDELHRLIGAAARLGPPGSLRPRTYKTLFTLLAVTGGWFLWKKVHGMGLGDVKMLAMIGAFLGWKGTLATLFVASFAGSLVGFALILSGRLNLKSRLPFGVFLALGGLVTLFLRHELLDLYNKVGLVTVSWFFD